MSTLWRAALLLLALAPYGLSAQTTFTVTVGNKTESNPYWGMGSSQTYFINGVEAKQIVLTRGQTYVFQMSGVPAFHPFYITTSDVGGGLGQFDEGVAGNLATGNQTLTFTPSSTAPDLLFYQCAVHSYMGWQILIQGSAGAVDDASRSATITTWPNPFDGEATLAVAVPTTSRVRVTLCDLFGNEVRTVHDGAIEAGAPTTLHIDGRGLPAGVYQLQIVGSDFARTEKIVLAK